MAILAGSNSFGSAARTRLEAVRRAVEQGEPLADSLERERLLPGTMVSLVHAAERVRNLPWALAEMGDNLARRAVRLVRQLSLAVFPVSVTAIGLLIGCAVVGMFMPLIDLISALSQ